MYLHIELTVKFCNSSNKRKRKEKRKSTTFFWVVFRFVEWISVDGVLLQIALPHVRFLATAVAFQ